MVGWLSSDAEEIERRRWRGRTEIGQIEPLERDLPYLAASVSGPPAAACMMWRSARSISR
jgi:hypothetical protein